MYYDYLRYIQRQQPLTTHNRPSREEPYRRLPTDIRPCLLASFNREDSVLMAHQRKVTFGIEALRDRAARNEIDA
jgi:hypothetical protein